MDFTKEQLLELSRAEVRELAGRYGININLRTNTLIERLLERQQDVEAQIAASEAMASEREEPNTAEEADEAENNGNGFTQLETSCSLQTPEVAEPATNEYPPVNGINAQPKEHEVGITSSGSDGGLESHEDSNDVVQQPLHKQLSSPRLAEEVLLQHDESSENIPRRPHSPLEAGSEYSFGTPESSVSPPPHFRRPSREAEDVAGQKTKTSSGPVSEHHLRTTVAIMGAISDENNALRAQVAELRRVTNELRAEANDLETMVRMQRARRERMEAFVVYWQKINPTVSFAEMWGRKKNGRLLVRKDKPRDRQTEITTSDEEDGGKIDRENVAVEEGADDEGADDFDEDEDDDDEGGEREAREEAEKVAYVVVKGKGKRVHEDHEGDGDTGNEAADESEEEKRYKPRQRIEKSKRRMTTAEVGELDHQFEVARKGMGLIDYDHYLMDNGSVPEDDVSGGINEEEWEIHAPSEYFSVMKAMGMETALAPPSPKSDNGYAVSWFLSTTEEANQITLGAPTSSRVVR